MVFMYSAVAGAPLDRAVAMPRRRAVASISIGSAPIAPSIK
jgi:hypothetical protein